MAILRPFFNPTLGVPQPVVASRRPRNMTEKMFYQQQAQEQPQQQAPPTTPVFQSPQQTRDYPVSAPEFEQPPVTGDYIQEQLERFRQSAGPPVLEPGSRVQSANAELVQPSEFKLFYEQLAAIDQRGKEMLGAEVARSQFRQMQALQAAAQTPSPSSGGSRSRQTGGRQAYGSGVPSNPRANFKYAQQVAPQFGWSGKELSAWYTLGMKESGWRNTAQNPTSTAYGIGQFLNSTWAGVGIAKTSDPQRQVLAMARYIKNRYGSPSRALAFHYANNWY